MIPGLLGALAAAVLYGVATVLQAAGVRQASGASGATVGLLVREGWLYGLGLGLDGLGFLASVAALRTLPLFVVESAVASSVAVTVLLAVVFLGVRLRGREVLALAAVAGGLVALALGAEPGSAEEAHGTATLWLLLALVVVAGLLALGASRPDGAGGLAATAGLAFGGTGVAARVTATPHPWWQLVTDPVVWCLLGFAVVATVAYGLALQRGSVTTTAAVTFSVETVVPAIVGLLWLGDAVRPGRVGLAVVGFALTLAGCVSLARHSTAEAATLGGSSP